MGVKNLFSFKWLLCTALFIIVLYIITSSRSLISGGGIFRAIDFEFAQFISEKAIQPCTPPDALNSFKRAKLLYKTNITLNEIDAIASQEIADYSCSYEKSKDIKVTFIIPYRNRKLDLLSFLIHMYPYFGQQNKSMEIVLAEQNGDGPFNRAKLFNAAVREIQKIRESGKESDPLFNSRCFAFHDVDKLPNNTDVPYSCDEYPKQLLRMYRNPYKYVSIYRTFLGGATMFSMENLEKINGASNSFEGWGGEDDDLWSRIHMAGMKVIQPPPEKGVFYEGNYYHGRQRNPNRGKLLQRKNQSQIMLTDGLRQVNYTLLSRVDFKTFIWMLFQL